MNTADNQTQNLNYNPRNPNLTNPGSKKFTRDYDKEPLVIKNYEEAYQVLLKIDALISCIPVFLSILIFVLSSFIRYKKEQPFLKIKNSSIEFYEKGKRVFVSKRDDLRKFIYKPFFFGSEKPRNWPYWLIIAAIFLYFICISSYSARFALTFVVFNAIGNFLTKFFFCLILGGKNAKFSFFPVICLDKSHGTAGNFWGVTTGSYFMITIFDKATYKEVKGYFLSKHGVNIDDIGKVYF